MSTIVITSSPSRAVRQAMRAIQAGQPVHITYKRRRSATQGGAHLPMRIVDYIKRWQLAEGTVSELRQLTDWGRELLAAWGDA